MLRAPGPDDAAALGRLHVRAWQAAYGDGLLPDEYLGGLSVQERTTMWVRALSRPPQGKSTRLVSVDDHGQVAGFVVAGPAEGDPDAAEGEVYALNVDPDSWSRGHGRALLEAAADHLKEAGFTEAILWVHRDNARARRFYESAGWVDDGVDRHEEVHGVEVPERRYRRRLL